MPSVRLSWAAAFLAAILIHAVVLAALSWKSDSDEAESARIGWEHDIGRPGHRGSAVIP